MKPNLYIVQTRHSFRHSSTSSTVTPTPFVVDRSSSSVGETQLGMVIDMANRLGGFSCWMVGWWCHAGISFPICIIYESTRSSWYPPTHTHCQSVSQWHSPASSIHRYVYNDRYVYWKRTRGNWKLPCALSFPSVFSRLRNCSQIPAQTTQQDGWVSTEQDRIE